MSTSTVNLPKTVLMTEKFIRAVFKFQTESKKVNFLCKIMYFAVIFNWINKVILHRIFKLRFNFLTVQIANGQFSILFNECFYSQFTVIRWYIQSVT